MTGFSQTDDVLENASEITGSERVETSSNSLKRGPPSGVKEFIAEP
jgi:hypothetical protein